MQFAPRAHRRRIPNLAYEVTASSIPAALASSAPVVGRCLSTSTRSRPSRLPRPGWLPGHDRHGVRKVALLLHPHRRPGAACTAYAWPAPHARHRRLPDERARRLPDGRARQVDRPGGQRLRADHTSPVRAVIQTRSPTKGPALQTPHTASPQPSHREHPGWSAMPHFRHLSGPHRREPAAGRCPAPTSPSRCGLHTRSAG